MTPAVLLLRRMKVEHRLHEYEHDPSHESYGLEAAEALGVDAGRVFKTLVAFAVDRLVVGVVPVDRQLDVKAMAAAIGAKSVAMADVAIAERTTGYVVGAISPLGQKKRLATVLDLSAEAWPTIYVSAGRRGLEVELSPPDLLRLTNGTFVPIAR